MTIQIRSFQPPQDYQRIYDFLAAHYQPRNPAGNWLAPAWEYAYFHPLMDETALGKIGIWEEEGEIYGVVNYGWHIGDAFFFFHPGYRHLRREMLTYAESNLSAMSQQGSRRYLCTFINDNDQPFLDLVKSRGFTREPENNLPACHMTIPDPLPSVPLPDGFRLQSLADDCDWAKVHRVMWRGFDHGDEVPMNEAELESRRRMFDTPGARRDLKIVVTAPDGEYAAICGMFYDSANRYAMVEPLATDPAYRRLGLGRAAVLEGIRRCAALGAHEAYVDNDLPFYQAMGFEKLFVSECWVKYWG